MAALRYASNRITITGDPSAGRVLSSGKPGKDTPEDSYPFETSPGSSACSQPALTSNGNRSRQFPLTRPGESPRLSDPPCRTLSHPLPRAGSVSQLQTTRSLRLPVDQAPAQLVAICRRPQNRPP